MNRVVQFQAFALAAFVILVCGCSSGAKVSINGKDSIFDAAANGDIDAVSAARQKGFRIDTPDAKGRTLLHYAVIGNQSGLVKRLLDDDANPLAKDAEGRTPLTYAQEAQNGEIVALLQRAGS